LITLVIEHLEPCINRWILAEYTFSAELFRSRIVFTNVKKPSHAEILSKLGRVESKSVVEWLGNREDVVVLDPQAKEPLDASDLKEASYVVVGGIMGSHPPEGRTWRLITSRMPRAKARNLGPEQFTIAGAVYVLKLIEEGRSLRDIAIIRGLRIERSLGRGVRHVIELPYAFPADSEGRPVLPRNYIDIVAEYTTVLEQRMLSGASCEDVY